MTQLKDQITSSARLSEFIHQNLGERADNLEPKHIVALALLSVALDHREATLLLVHSGAYTSSRAVARSALEAYVTGLWFETAATDGQVHDFMHAARPKPPPTFESMVQRLRQAHALGKLFETLRGHYKTLSDYAHGHARQVSRWIDREGNIEPRHSDEEMAEVLRFVDTIGMLACLSRENIAGRPIEPFATMFDRVVHRQY
jgi:hypothetical protein